MNIEEINARNFQWGNADQNCLDMDIDHPIHGTIRFTAALNDYVDYSVALFNAHKDREDIAAYVEPEEEE